MSVSRRPGRATRAILAGLTVVLAAVLGGCGGHPTSAAKTVPRSGAISVVLHSRADLRPPQVVVDRRLPAPDAGSILITPRGGTVKAPDYQQGAMILDGQGRTQWFHPAPHAAPIINLQVQRYQGKPVLTWWQGLNRLGIGSGEAVIADEHYHPIATVHTSEGFGVDLHEFRLTPRGTALITVYKRAAADLSAIGGAKNGLVSEGVVEEIDVRSGRVLWKWESLDHVAPAESLMKPPADKSAPFDYFHINAVDERAATGTVLISARNTSTIYEVDRATGRVRWRLGGRRSDFALGPGAGFGLQHDARYVGAREIELFDNGPQETRPASSGKTLELDLAHHRAMLLRHFDQPQRLWAETQGGVQDLPDGGAFVGWGALGRFSRFDARGRLVFDAHLPEGYDDYRAFAQRWVGRPTEPPALAAQAAGATTTLYASWNGATEVRWWQVLAGPTRRRLSPVGAPVAWTGLETAIPTSTTKPFVAVRALDAGQRPLGVSPAVARP